MKSTKQLPTTHYPLQNKGGFTLIEMLLYVGLASIILLVTSVFLGMLLESRIKNQTVAEVEGQGIQVMQAVAQTVRNAEAINSPTAGNSANSLSLDVVNVANDPTVFSLSGGQVEIKEGANTAINLTNSRVMVSDLNFENLSRTGTPGNIQISFTITHVNPEGKNTYSYSKSFISSASLRHP